MRSVGIWRSAIVNEILNPFVAHRNTRRERAIETGGQMRNSPFVYPVDIADLLSQPDRVI